MTNTAKLYATSVTAMGLIALAAHVIGDWNFPETERFFVFVILACFAAMMKVKVPTMNGTISVNFVFILIALAEMNLTETLIMGALATLLQCLWMPKSRPKPIQVLFNVAVIAISTIAAYRLPLVFGLRPGHIVTLTLAACIFFVTNSALVAFVIALAENQNVQQIWRTCYLWTFPYYIAGAGIAAFVNSSTQEIGWKLSLLILPLMYLVYHYYRLCVSERSDKTEQGALLREAA